MPARFGKAAGPMLRHKASFFASNDALLHNTHQIAELYVRQPPRTQCKNCDAPLSQPDFAKLGISYSFCTVCGHLNGAAEDTDPFCNAIYADDGGKTYATNYSASDVDAYWARVRDIYVPKAQFLQDALLAEGCDPCALSYADLGAGSGYFLAAVLERGFPHVIGYDVSAAQVELANRMLRGSPVRRHQLGEMVTIAATVEADVVSLIGVIEHVQHPRELLAALRANSHVCYIFLSVPLFSPCVFFEMVFPTIFNRQLSGGHTHLYTESSLKWMCQHHGLTRVAEWWFGTDMLDLYRSVLVRLTQQPETSAVAKKWTAAFRDAIDELQLVLDKRRLSSEVHLLLKAS
jgi:2-polyprenyl-3-methyl-5-hydroxy-6-metoxy-1,4-benzoquinol methylase